MNAKAESSEVIKYCRDRPNDNSVRAKLDLLWETSEQVQRLRSEQQNLDEKSEKILGSPKDLEMASSMLDKALSMQLYEISERALKKAVKENQISQSEADKVNTLRITEQRRLEMLNMRLAQERGETERDR